MPIIPANWTGIETVNAENMGGSGFPIYQFSKSFSITISELNTFIDLIGICDTPINREISLDILSGSLQLYWKNYDNTYTQISRDNLNFNNGYGYVDTTLGQLGLSVKVSEPTELFLVTRWDKDFDFDIYTPAIAPLDLQVTVTDNNIVNFSNYGSVETFTLIIGETFNYSNGVLWGILGYWKNSFNGLYTWSNSVLMYNFTLALTESDRIFGFDVDFEYLILDEFLPEIKFFESYEDPERGTIPNPNKNIIVEYDSENRAFTINH